MSGTLHPLLPVVAAALLGTRLLACRVLASLVYSIVHVLLDLFLVRAPAGRARDAELLALRHEARVLRRHAKRVPWRPGDRLIFAALSRCLPRTGWHVFPVRPETLLRWRRELVRRKWAAFGRRRGPGRPAFPADVVELVVRLARGNPRWGYQRITGERLKLGHDISATAVRSVRRRRRVPPAPRRAGLAQRHGQVDRGEAETRRRAALPRQIGPTRTSTVKPTQTPQTSVTGRSPCQCPGRPRRRPGARPAARHREAPSQLPPEVEPCRQR